jgi:hypothetical protein
MELGIRPSFVKTSEFRGGGLKVPNPSPLGTPLIDHTNSNELLCSLKDMFFAS